MSNATLVVIPQEGQGAWKNLWNWQGGRPSCRWVPAIRGLPSASYGESHAATANVKSPRVATTAAARREARWLGVGIGGADRSGNDVTD